MISKIKGIEIDLSQFVSVWQKSDCVADVASHFGVNDVTRVTQLAGYLRKKGVALKKFQRGKKAADWGVLSALVEG